MCHPGGEALVSLLGSVPFAIHAPSHGLPALLYDIKCSGSLAYMALARELLARQTPPDARRAA